MSYKDDIKELREKLRVLGYEEIPNVLDIETEDFSSAYQDMGYTLIPINIEGETVSNNAFIGERVYSLSVTYKAQKSAEYDTLWTKFEALYTAMHLICHSVESEPISKLESKQFIYLGKMELRYGTKTC